MSLGFSVLFLVATDGASLYSSLQKITINFFVLKICNVLLTIKNTCEYLNDVSGSHSSLSTRILHSACKIYLHIYLFIAGSFTIFVFMYLPTLLLVSSELLLFVDIFFRTPNNTYEFFFFFYIIRLYSVWHLFKIPA